MGKCFSIMIFFSQKYDSTGVHRKYDNWVEILHIKHDLVKALLNFALFSQPEKGSLAKFSPVL